MKESVSYVYYYSNYEV